MRSSEVAYITFSIMSIYSLALYRQPVLEAAQYIVLVVITILSVYSHFTHTTGIKYFYIHVVKDKN